MLLRDPDHPIAEPSIRASASKTGKRAAVSGDEMASRFVLMVDSSPKEPVVMIWMKFVLTALVCAPLCLGAYVLVGHLLHFTNSGHATGETVELTVLNKQSHGVSTPPLKGLLAPISAVGEKMIKGALDSLLRHESSKYTQSYTARITRDDFYISGGTLADRWRLEELVEHSNERLQWLKEADASELDIKNFHDELDVANAHLAWFNPNNACSIGIVRLVRMISVKGTARAASTIELIPVSNESGTLLKFKVWKFRIDHAKCLVSKWHGKLDYTIGLQLLGANRGAEGQFTQEILLDDAIEIRGVEIGRTYTSSELRNQETGWFPFPARLEYSMGFNQGPDTTMLEKDFGNYTLTALVVEHGE